MNRYSAMSLCQRGPSQRPCLALIAEVGVDPQLLWDFTVRAPSCGKVVGIALCFSSLCRRHGDLPWVLSRGGSPDPPMEATQKRKLGDEQISSSLLSVSGKTSGRILAES